MADRDRKSVFWTVGSTDVVASVGGGKDDRELEKVVALFVTPFLYHVCI